MPTLATDLTNIFFAVVLVLINGFFVAAEFALVKVRPARIDEQVEKKVPFALTARWMVQRMDATLSAHLVFGEQAPKIYALRQPEKVLLWLAIPMKLFYFLSYPFMVVLNTTTSFLLKTIDVDSVSEHDVVHSEDEIKALLRLSHKHGELSRSEHRLINAVFEFDDTVVRRVMQPRADIIFFDINRSFAECQSLAKKNKHSRYPLCDGSLDSVLGIVHIKDLIDVSSEAQNILRSITRPVNYVPETIRISLLLRQFQETHQQMALVVDEYGTVIGCATLEDVLEQIVGPVEDEFETHAMDIESNGSDKFTVSGGTLISTVNKQLNLNLESVEAETLSGLLMEQKGQVLKIGDRIELGGVVAEVLGIKGSRASSIQINLPQPRQESFSNQAS
jgi:CBS domain containing-hemolysin-like protein